MPSYGLTCADCGAPMYKVAKSLPQGVARCHSCRRASPPPPRVIDFSYKKTLPCADCGRVGYRSTSSLPEGQARCLDCRRAARASRESEKPPPRVRLPAMCAGGCGTPIGLDLDDRRWKWCSVECRDQTYQRRGRRWSAPKRSATDRGYGYAHRKLRKQLLPEAYGKPCPLCGFTMDEGDLLHLDHTEDRTGYRGMVHAICNLRDGARRGNKAANRGSKSASGKPG